MNSPSRRPERPERGPEIGASSQRGARGTTVEPYVVGERIGPVLIPVTAASALALKVCQSGSPRFLTNHALRTYVWSVLLAGVDGNLVDEELLFVAGILHDLGLTRRYARSGCFEDTGAKVASALTTSMGWTPSRAHAARSAIAAHMGATGHQTGPEARQLDDGVTFDVTGARWDDIEDRTRRLVLARVPRLDFKRRFLALLRADAAREPQCMTSVLLGEHALADRVIGSPFAS